jgi:hypothetical protein
MASSAAATGFGFFGFFGPASDVPAIARIASKTPDVRRACERIIPSV